MRPIAGRVMMQHLTQLLRLMKLRFHAPAKRVCSNSLFQGTAQKAKLFRISTHRLMVESVVRQVAVASVQAPSCSLRGSLLWIASGEMQLNLLSGEINQPSRFGPAGSQLRWATRFLQHPFCQCLQAGTDAVPNVVGGNTSKKRRDLRFSLVPG